MRVLENKNLYLKKTDVYHKQSNVSKKVLIIISISHIGIKWSIIISVSISSQLTSESVVLKHLLSLLFHFVLFEQVHFYTHYTHSLVHRKPSYVCIYTYLLCILSYNHIFSEDNQYFSWYVGSSQPMVYDPSLVQSHLLFSGGSNSEYTSDKCELLYKVQMYVVHNQWHQSAVVEGILSSSERMRSLTTAQIFCSHTLFLLWC